MSLDKHCLLCYYVNNMQHQLLQDFYRDYALARVMLNECEQWEGETFRGQYNPVALDELRTREAELIDLLEELTGIIYELEHAPIEDEDEEESREFSDELCSQCLGYDDESCDCDHCLGTGKEPVEEEEEEEANPRGYMLISADEAIAALPEHEFIHCFLGFIGADWRRASVIEDIKNADRVAWLPNLFDHDLAVEGGGRSVRHFDVRMPEDVKKALKQGRIEEEDEEEEADPSQAIADLVIEHHYLSDEPEQHIDLDEGVYTVETKILNIPVWETPDHN